MHHPNNEDDEISEESDILALELNFEEEKKEDLDKPVDDINPNAEVQLPPFIFRHSDTFRMRWDLFVIVLALWNCLSIPYTVSFEVSIDDLLALVIFERVIDICFFLDIIFNFRTTYIN